jgi:hypothetical protein
MNMNTVGYAILVSDPKFDAAQSLAAEVKALIRLNLGWEPTGGPFVMPTTEGPKLGQAMVQKAPADRPSFPR